MKTLFWLLCCTMALCQIPDLKRYARYYRFDSPYKQLPPPDTTLLETLWQTMEDTPQQQNRKTQWYYYYDPAIKQGIQAYKDYHKNATTIMGYRIQLCFDVNKQNVVQCQEAFKKVFPELPCFIHYKRPVYRLYAGAFYTEEQAQRFKEEQLKTFLPQYYDNAIILKMPIPKQ